MTDEPNVNKYMGGYDDAAQFTNADPPPPKRVHAANSGRVDPHLTHYVGTEAARELRTLFEDMSTEIEQLQGVVWQEFQTGGNELSDQFKETLGGFRARLNDLLGLSE